MEVGSSLTNISSGNTILEGAMYSEYVKSNVFSVITSGAFLFSSMTFAVRRTFSLHFLSLARDV